MLLFDYRRYAVKVRDKNVKQMVDVSDKDCPKREGTGE